MSHDAASQGQAASRGLGSGADREHDQPGAEPLVIDCDRCSVRGLGCGDCVVTVLLGGPPYGVELDAEERRALGVLADAGLVPPLRMVESVEATYIDPP